MKLTDDEKLHEESSKQHYSKHSPRLEMKNQDSSSSSLAAEDHHHHDHQAAKLSPRSQHKQQTVVKKSLLEKKSSKTTLGCFQRPRLPDEIRDKVQEQSMVRSDLSMMIIVNV